MPVTSAVTAPYNSTGNQTQIANTHSITDADPSTLSNTRTNTVRRTKYTTPALEKLSELSYISILILHSFFHILYSDSPISLSLMICIYLASEQNR